MSIITVADELTDLLDPVTPESFTTEYWCRKPLFIKGRPEKLQSLFQGGFARKDFEQSVHEAARKKIAGFRLLARKHAGLLPTGSGKSYLPIQPEQMDWLFASGAIISAICVSDNRVDRFAAALKAQLHHAGDVKIAVKLSPKGVGWLPHIDEVSVINIQCEGRKRFLISPETVAHWPRGETEFANDGSLIEITLEPGDVLFFPPGTVHATENLTESTLTIGLLFEHKTPIDLMSQVFEREFVSNPDWRSCPAIRSNHARGELPPEAKKFFAARLEECRELVNTLTPDSPELHRLWRKLIADPGTN